MSRESSRGVAFVVFPLVCLFFVGLGLHMIWHSVVTLPRVYVRLASNGVPAIATVDKCARGLGGGHGVACRLTLDFLGSDRTWVYPENSGQFEDLPTGSEVAMLVDPGNRRVAYTATDVRERTNAGYGVVAAFGTVFACVGAVGLGSLAWLVRMRRRSPATPGNASTRETGRYW